ncbi:hypothetical protein HHK36_016333 [Tetracentron sinense]|uniref:Uncharacterized protein n=1 Tax=Tetracentron sinense TaxID=13715 RepID=A0A834Z5L3_TETSI|nr:hypothetical protein HHK36_016333 [Tetracentron sinense]
MTEFINVWTSEPSSQGSRPTGETVSGLDNRMGGEESTKPRRVSSPKHATESSTFGDDTLSALLCLVALSPGVRIATVAAGGRHTLALSGLEGQVYKGPGSYVKDIACGGRHSSVITVTWVQKGLLVTDMACNLIKMVSDAGAVLNFGWGLYGQCGQGSTDDELSPSCVSPLLGIRIEGVASGLWHTVCISVEGDVYTFGGNQFGQLGTGSDQAEILPRLLEAPSLESKHSKIVSCGARHSAIITEEEELFCWGWNKYGQLGLGDVTDRNIRFSSCHRWLPP